MKIIGVAGRDQFLAMVSQVEIEKSFNRYYGKLETKLDVGTEIDLGAGYNFCADIQRACSDMTDAMKQFERARATLMAFAIMVSNLPPELRPGMEGGDA